MTQLVLGPIIGGLSSEPPQVVEVQTDDDATQTAKLWGRADGEGTLHAWIGRRSDLSDAQLAGESLPLRPEDGFAGVAPVSNLAPETLHYYTLTLSDTKPAPDAGPFPSFKTFPSRHQPTSFSFAFGSCFRPEGPEEAPIFERLAEKLETDDLRFLLMIGDQIYADDKDHNSLRRIAASLDDYRVVYEYTWKRAPFRRLLERIPTFMTLDDHEVDDDWCWTDSGRSKCAIPVWDHLLRRLRGDEPSDLTTDRAKAALKAFWEHQGMHSPAHHETPLLDANDFYTLEDQDPGSFAYSFTFGSAAFFVMDTRTRRVRDRRGGQKTILGDAQWDVLEQWLLRVSRTYPVKFLVTSSALLVRLWIDILYDRWGGFASERDHLLDFIAANGIKGVYLLSGDLHSAHAVEAELECSRGHTIRLWEYCSSPFEQSTSWLSSHTFNPFRYARIKHLHRHFSYSQPNFGIVRVDFSEQEDPRVTFDVYDKEGNVQHSTAEKP